MHWLLAGAIALIALILAPGLSFYFDVTPKLIVLLTAVGYGMDVAAVSWRHPLWMLTALSAVSLAISSAARRESRTEPVGHTWRGYGAFTQIAILLLAVSISAQAHHIVPMLRVIVAAGALTAVYGIAQYFGRRPDSAGGRLPHRGGHLDDRASSFHAWDT